MGKSWFDSLKNRNAQRFGVLERLERFSETVPSQTEASQANFRVSLSGPQGTAAIRQSAVKP
jgi:hypothetical protein